VYAVWDRFVAPPSGPDRGDDSPRDPTAWPNLACRVRAVPR
jgi:hypothetical protein